MSNSVQKILGIVNVIKSTPNNQFSIDYSEYIHDKIEFDRIQNDNKKKGINGLFKKSRERINVLSKMYDANIIRNIELKSSYSFNISLSDIFNLIPMSEKRVRKYKTLVRDLSKLGITMNIIN